MGFSQKKLAEKCGTGHSYIRQLESGKGSPSFAFIGKIASALQVEPYKFFYDETAKKDQTERSKNIEAIQAKLLESISDNIHSAFDEINT